MIERENLNLSRYSTRSKSINLVFVFIGLLLSVIIGLAISGVTDRKYLLLSVLGLIAFAVTFARLDLGVAGMVLALYTQTHFVLGERYGITDVVQGLIALLLAAMVTRWVVYPPEVPEGWMRPLFLAGFYCMVCLASVMYAVTPSVAMPIAIDTLKSGIIAMIIAVNLRTRNSFRLAIWTLLAAGIFLGTLSVIQFASGTYGNDYGGYAEASFSNISGETDDYRLGGPVGDPNYYAQMMLVLVPLALDRLWHERQRILRVLAAWALGVCSFTVLLTYSRGGFISMMIVIVAMLFVFHRGQLRYVLVAAVFALLLLNFLPERFTQRIGTLAELVPGTSANSGASQDSSFRGRTSEMLVAFRMFADYPIFGAGLGNYPLLYQQYAQRVGLEFRAEVRQAHSLYLEIASETGLLGIFSFGVLVWGMFRAIWNSYQTLIRKGLVSTANMVAAHTFGMLGFLIAASFIHAVFFRNFWVIAGIAFAVPRMAAIEIEDADKIRHKLLQRDDF